MPEINFDEYVGEYRNIINQVSRISGEQFEFFIQLRLQLMKSRVFEQFQSLNKIRILDFGCGAGATEIYLKETFPEASIYAIDSSAQSIRAARERNIEGVEFIHSDAFELPFPDSYFDLIYSNGTFHHIPPLHHKKIISEISRICRVGGNFFIFENNPKNPLMMRAMRNNPFDADAIVVRPYMLKRITAIAGFVQKEVCYYFFFPKFLRFLRFSEKWLSSIPLGAQYFYWSIKQPTTN
ncbi:class I SAM-dependent methyltransferase [Oryzomonas japonica]|nr:class I SAM-dependent methyltransferase [Oryzomonas japonica]